MRTVEFIIAAAVQPEIKNHASDFLLRRLLKEPREELGDGLPAARISNLVELDIKSLAIGKEFAPVILDRYASTRAAPERKKLIAC